MYVYSSIYLPSLLVSICIGLSRPTAHFESDIHMSTVDRHKDLLERDQAVLVVVDVQERFVDHIFESWPVSQVGIQIDKPGAVSLAQVVGVSLVVCRDP